MTMTKDDLMQAIKGLSVIELSELVKALEEEFGVSAAAPVAVAAAPTAASAAEEEEQTEFVVVLQNFGENKINVIKAVREVTSLGLREAKDLVEAAPTNVREAVTKEEGNSIKAKLEEAGATVAVQ
jgi:large subunit ribosomal protein L7/L12